MTELKTGDRVVFKAGPNDIPEWDGATGIVVGPAGYGLTKVRLEKPVTSWRTYSVGEEVRLRTLDLSRVDPEVIESLRQAVRAAKDAGYFVDIEVREVVTEMVETTRNKRISL